MMKRSEQLSTASPNLSVYHPHRVALSIIIVHYKTVELTLQCIASIYEYKPEYSFEILVVDNGSQDDIEALMHERFPEVRFITTGRNSGFTSGSNLGIYNAHGEAVVLLNSDTKIIQPIFDAMVHYLETHPEVGILGPRHVDGRSRFQLSFGHFPTFYSELIRKLVHYRLSINDIKVRDYLDEKYSASSVLDWVSGSFLMVRRAVLQEIGLLDEQIFMYFEDIDLCTRARRSGWYVHYFPYATVLHYGGQSVRKNLLGALVGYRKSQIYFAGKYYGALGGFVLRVLLFFKYSANFIKWGVIHFFRLVFGGDLVGSYTALLLAKKVISAALGRVPAGPIEPRIAAEAAAVKF